MTELSGNQMLPLDRAFNLTFDLIAIIDADSLQLKLKGLPANTICEQLWCVVGARENCLNAITNQRQIGFSCSLDNTIIKSRILESHKKSSEDCLAMLNRTELNEKQLELLLALLEREVQHHGQLIRYILSTAINLHFPKAGMKDTLFKLGGIYWK